MKVLKFGGSSVANSENIQKVLAIVKQESKNEKVAVVVSAFGKTTDQLISAGNKALKNIAEAKETLETIKKLHDQIITDLITTHKKEVRSEVADLFKKLVSIYEGLYLLQELSDKTLAKISSFGERLSSLIIANAAKELFDATHEESRKLITTNNDYLNAQVNFKITDVNITSFFDKNKHQVVFLGGFISSNSNHETTTLGRGGSDYSATIIGSCIKADEIWLMSDVDGLMTADPKIVKNAKLLKEVSYTEAIEMALFGAKQIHPRTFEPLLAKKIPMKIRNSFSTSNEGTLVTASPSASVKNTVKCVSNIRNNGLIDIRGGSMIGTPGTAAKIFATLAKAGINVMMISQNPSESSITIVVKNSDLDKAVSVLEMDLLGKIIKKLEVTTGVSIIALIGSGMRGTIGVASKVFAAIEKNKVNVSMITQGSSELNLALVVKNSDTNSAVRAIHNAFTLDKIN